MELTGKGNDILDKAEDVILRGVDTLADLDAVQDGEFVIITLNMLSKYRKQWVLPRPSR